MRIRKIKGYENYFVSDCGRVFSTKRDRVKELKPDIVQGYYRFTLSKDNKIKRYLGHRLVAETFIDNPECKLTVNHIDSDRLNNKTSNLEWATYSENNKHAFEYGNNFTHNKIKVRCLNNGIVYDSFTKAADELGVDRRKVAMVANGKRNHTHGYKFEFVEEVIHSNDSN